MDYHQKFLLGLITAGVIGASGGYTGIRHYETEAKEWTKRSDVGAYLIVHSDVKQISTELTNLEQKIKNMENLSLDSSAEHLKYFNIRGTQSRLLEEKDGLSNLPAVEEYRGLRDWVGYSLAGMTFFGAMAAFGTMVFFRYSIFHPIRSRRKERPVPV